MPDAESLVASLTAPRRGRLAAHNQGRRRLRPCRGARGLIELDGRVRLSQRRRRLVASALSKGKIHALDFPSFRDASREYIRNSMDLDGLEARARFTPIVRR